MVNFRKIFACTPLFCAFAFAALHANPLIGNVQRDTRWQIPVPIYAQGPNVGTADCQSVLRGIIANECGRRNNCAGLAVHAIRPVVITQLSAIPGANFVNACAGFIDGMFDEYMRNVAAAHRTAAAFPTAFPTAPAPAPTAFPAAPAATAFPTTFDQLSFVERQAVIREGIEPWAPVYRYGVCVENCTYQALRIETDADRRVRERDEWVFRCATIQEQNLEQWCDECHSEMTDERCCVFPRFADWDICRCTIWETRNCLLAGGRPGTQFCNENREWTACVPVPEPPPPPIVEVPVVAQRCRDSHGRDWPLNDWVPCTIPAVVAVPATDDTPEVPAQPERQGHMQCRYDGTWSDCVAGGRPAAAGTGTGGTIIRGDGQPNIRIFDLRPGARR
ncbi:MAG: hypothetical protein FWE64_03330 [Alphaproteobacteria bacterium]|nr:hypothetical protein [Alphaproteobacteria bacterium]